MPPQAAVSAAAVTATQRAPARRDRVVVMRRR
jgi:hypothetical protein